MQIPTRVPSVVNRAAYHRHRASEWILIAWPVFLLHKICAGMPLLLQWELGFLIFRTVP
jgi:hypothetical protein